MSKIELEFNSTAYQKELNRLVELGQTFSKVEKYILEITNNEVNEFDLEIITEWIKNKYGFINVAHVMMLQNQETQFSFVKHFLLENEPTLLKSFSLNSKGVYEPNTDVLTALKERFTTYVDDEMIADYNALIKAQKALEKCNNRMLKFMLITNINGTSIDLKRFSAIQNAIKRNLI